MIALGCFVLEPMICILANNEAGRVALAIRPASLFGVALTLRAWVSALLPQNLPQGPHCLRVRLVQLRQQLGRGGFVAVSEGVVHAFRQFVYAGE